jgi:hypothetical protein
MLDSFDGANDDAKLTAAMAYCAAQTYKPAILISNRQHLFSQANRLLYSGFKMVGLGGQGDQQTSCNEVGNELKFTGTGVWLVAPAASTSTRGLYLGGLFFEGNSGAQFMQSNPGVTGKAVFENLGFNLWKHVLGNPTQKWLSTACQFQGWWNVNNGYDTAFTLGGSDSNFWTDGMLLDSPPTLMNASSYHLIFDYQEKTSVGPIYCTADRSSGVWVKGGSTTAGMVMYGAGRVEGRNCTTPCAGANIRIDGGMFTIRDWWVSYGGSSFNSNGHTGEGGIITQTGGQVLYDGLYYDKTSAVAETVPFLYVAGGKARVRNIRTGAKGGAWTGLPRVKAAGGSVDADNSVTVI